MEVAFAIRSAEPSEFRDALKILCSIGGESAAETREELFDSHERGDVSFEGLLIAVGEEILGAGMYVLQPGGVAFVWPVVVVDSHKGEAIEERIYREIQTRLQSAGVRIGQVLLDPGLTSVADSLNRHGFRFLTNLRYLLRPVGAAMGGFSPLSLKSETFAESKNASRFGEVLSRTYEETQDCPELNGSRSAEEALRGHQATGEFQPERWRIYSQGDRDVAVLLINAHPDRDLLEIVYVGVVPENRGSGIGAWLLNEAVRMSHAEKRAIVLGVDERNSSARSLYRKWGFLELTTQAVHVWQPETNARIR